MIQAADDDNSHLAQNACRIPFFWESQNLFPVPPSTYPGAWSLGPLVPLLGGECEYGEFVRKIIAPWRPANADMSMSV